MPEKIVAQTHSSLSTWMSFKCDISLSEAMENVSLAGKGHTRHPATDDDDDIAIGFIPSSSSRLPDPFSSRQTSLFFCSDDVFITSHSTRSNAHIVRRNISALATIDAANN